MKKASELSPLRLAGTEIYSIADEIPEAGINESITGEIIASLETTLEKFTGVQYEAVAMTSYEDAVGFHIKFQNSGELQSGDTELPGAVKYGVKTVNRQGEGIKSLAELEQLGHQADAIAVLEGKGVEGFQKKRLPVDYPGTAIPATHSQSIPESGPSRIAWRYSLDPEQ